MLQNRFLSPFEGGFSFFFSQRREVTASLSLSLTRYIRVFNFTSRRFFREPARDVFPLGRSEIVGSRWRDESCPPAVTGNVAIAAKVSFVASGYRVGEAGAADFETRGRSFVRCCR